MFLAVDDERMLAVMEALAVAAGIAIARIAEGAVAIETKADDTPVTAADREAEAIILTGLRKNYPEIPVVAEEEYAAGRVVRVSDGTFFLVDPLDGTREFVAGRPDYTVNIALIRSGRPEIGVVHAPARRRLWSGMPGHAGEAAVSGAGDVSVRKSIRVVPARQPPRIVASRSHNTPETDAFIARYPGAPIVSIGSSIKFCLIAAGEADLYPRFGRTMEWDTAAGDAVLRAAGGMTRTLDGLPMLYGKAPVFENPDFIAAGET